MQPSVVSTKIHTYQYHHLQIHHTFPHCLFGAVFLLFFVQVQLVLIHITSLCLGIDPASINPDFLPLHNMKECLEDIAITQSKLLLLWLIHRLSIQGKEGQAPLVFLASSKELNKGSKFLYSILFLRLAGYLVCTHLLGGRVVKTNLSSIFWTLTPWNNTTAETCNKAQANTRRPEEARLRSDHTIVAKNILEINLHLSIPTLLRMNAVQLLLTNLTNQMAMRTTQGAISSTRNSKGINKQVVHTMLDGTKPS